MQLEFHQLEPRGEHLRVQSPQQLKRLLVSLLSSGQQTPIVVVPLENQPNRYLVIDGEDLRNREDLSLDHLLKNSRILMSTVAHEIRNLSGALLVVHKNLSRMKELETNEDFQALGGLIQSMERISSLELGSASAQNGEAVELTSVLDELRILIETTYHESDIKCAVGY